MRRHIAGLLLAVVAIGPAQAIVGPSREAAAFGDRVLMVLQRRGTVVGFCTGIVIAPRAVLTAAHCVPPGADLRVHFRGPGGEPVLLPVASVVRHPGYRADAVARRERSIDLAVLRLAEPLPDRFRPAEIADTAGTTPGAAVRVLGYGVAREGEGASSGVLREADLAAETPLSAVLLWAADPRQGGAGACTGDSGGPVLSAEGDAVVALTLWAAGDTGHALRPNRRSGSGSARQCGALTQALWLAPYRAWIAEAAGR